MRSPLARTLVAGGALLLFGSAVTLAQLPPGHPGTGPGRKTPEPQPEATQPQEQAPEKAPEFFAPRPEDVQSVDAIVLAYYDSISGPKGEKRNWDRFRSLFLPDADLMSVQQMHQSTKIISLTPEEYMHLNGTYFEKGGYFESEIHRETRSYGFVAQIFSTYESRRQAEGEAYSRGINAFQLLFDGNRWWIASATWDRELPNNPIPAEFLPE